MVTTNNSRVQQAPDRGTRLPFGNGDGAPEEVKAIKSEMRRHPSPPRHTTIRCFFNQLRQLTVLETIDKIYPRRFPSVGGASVVILQGHGHGQPALGAGHRTARRGNTLHTGGSCGTEYHGHDWYGAD